MRALQNIRLASALAVSLGWTAILTLSLFRLYDRAKSYNGIGSDPLDGVVVVWLGLALAVAYVPLALYYGKRRPTSLGSAFVMVLAFVPMAMMSFALAVDHTLGSAMGDLIAVTSGVFNLAVIVTSVMIFTRAAREARHTGALAQ